MNSDNISMLHTEVVANNTVHSRTPIVKVIIRKHDQHCVFPLLALNENCIAAEELQCFHGIIREGDNGIIIVNGIGDTVATRLARQAQ